MNKTEIDWADYSFNPVKGLCPMACTYCYARRFYKRFGWDETIRYDDSVFSSQLPGKPGDRYFVGSTMELFGPWIEEWWLKQIFEWVSAYPQRTFIFLTKRPENLIKWSPFPKNCWVGVSAATNSQLQYGLAHIADVQATVKFISFEPLLERMSFLAAEMVDGIIIGQQWPATKMTEPKILWIQELLVAASNAGNIPVFIKDNLKPLLAKEWPGWKIRQELPEVAHGR
jgi:protein gp37